MASISIWAPRKLWIRGASVIATAGLIIVSNIDFSDLPSRPIPIHLEWAMRTVTEARVLGASPREGEAIFVWLQIRGVTEPRAYRMPWSRELAQQLQDATEQNRGTQTGVRMRSPFRNQIQENNQRQAFYSPLRRSLALKDARESEPMIFEESR
ncbi:MAG TPA: hypothetical protein EYM34_04570 [Alphaproteobacteria bacterium]|nr:hypothetical protein [Alphaproteobacteria bacterium]